ncbi:MAG: fibronectin-binding autotransporter adhesin, partial [Verrucomicrobiota bacterium]
MHLSWRLTEPKRAAPFSTRRRLITNVKMCLDLNPRCWFSFPQPCRNMKPPRNDPNSPAVQQILFWCLCLCFAVLANNARAGLSYWDKAGNWGSYATYTAGSLGGTWDGIGWSAVDTGQASPNNFTEGNAAVFAVGAGATNSGTAASTTTFTVTMNNPHTVAGFFDGALMPNSCIVTITGSGVITLPAGQDAFDVDNSTDSSVGQVIVNNVMTGPGQITAEGNGQIFLNGVNTFTGGLTLGYANGGNAAVFTGIVNFNNSASFGTGGIIISNTATFVSALVAEGTSAITVTNPVTVMTSNSPSLNIVGNPAGVTFSGPWVLNKTLTLGSGVAGNLVTISGIISGSGGLTKFNPATLALTGANTYTGGTTNNAGTLSVNAIADSGTSAIGLSGNLTFGGGKLSYTGAGAATTSRAVFVSANSSVIDLPAGNLTLNGAVKGAASFTL